MYVIAGHLGRISAASRPHLGRISRLILAQQFLELVVRDFDQILLDHLINH